MIIVHPDAPAASSARTLRRAAPRRRARHVGVADAVLHYPSTALVIFCMAMVTVGAALAFLVLLTR